MVYVLKYKKRAHVKADGIKGLSVQFLNLNTIPSNSGINSITIVG